MNNGSEVEPQQTTARRDVEAVSIAKVSGALKVFAEWLFIVVVIVSSVVVSYYFNENGKGGPADSLG